MLTSGLHVLISLTRSKRFHTWIDLKFIHFELQEPSYNQEGSTKGSDCCNELKNLLFQNIYKILRFGLYCAQLGSYISLAREFPKKCQVRQPSGASQRGLVDLTGQNRFNRLQGQFSRVGPADFVTQLRDGPRCSLVYPNSTRFKTGSTGFGSIEPGTQSSTRPGCSLVDPNSARFKPDSIEIVLGHLTAQPETWTRIICAESRFGRV